MKKILLIVIGIIIIVIAFITVYYYINVKKTIDSSEEIVNIEVVEGESTEEIAEKLKQKGLIKSPIVFSAYTFFSNKNILPGIYYIKKNLSIEQILNILSEGKTTENKITIIEGWRIKEIANYLTQELKIDKNEFLAESKELEGLLFPDTYQIPIDATAKEIIQKMNDNFKQKTIGLNLTQDQLILASIIEREAKKNEDRAKIAGIYQNRLDIEMKLDADPTVQYAKGNWELITQSDYYNTDSPYNTYTNNGLPPGPICNPGIASIKAAINPEKHNYYYFFHLANGSTIYSETLDEHNANVIKYTDQM